MMHPRGEHRQIPERPSSHLIGRDAELAVLHNTIALPPQGRVIVVSGALGSGKTTFLTAAVRQANSLGHRVLDIAGLPGESGTPLAGLHRLLRTLSDTEANPYGRANIIETLFSTPMFGDQVHTARLATALLELLDAVPKKQPILVTVDDAHWLDEQSRSVLMFAARRSTGRPITVVLTLPDTTAPTGLVGRSSIEIPLTPMDLPHSIELLEAQPTPPSGLLREQILRLSAGNPAALVHFCRATTDRAPTMGYAPDPLPLPISIHAGYTERLAHLPADTRDALVVAAAASCADLSALDPATLADLTAFAPAETAGILRVESARICFVNPLMRSASYYGAPLATRLHAHQRLAEALTAVPYRQIWHRSQAVSTTDSALAQQLALTYEEALHNDGYAAAAIVLQRSAALTADPGEQIRLLLQVCELARKFGDLAWTARLSGQVLAALSSPQDRIRALTELGLATIWSDGQAAVTTLLDAAEEALDVEPELAWEPLRSAAAATFLTDSPSAHEATGRVLRKLEGAMRHRSHEASASRLWIHAVIDPQRTHTGIAQFSEKSSGTSDVLHTRLVGLAAGITDESDLSVRNLRYVRSVSTRSHSPHGGALTTTILAWSAVDSGRWDEALRMTDELHTLGTYGDQPLVCATGDLIRAAVLARRGDTVSARNRITEALSAMDFKDNRAHAAWTHHALGLVNLVEGNELAAYGHLAELFSDSGVPLHRHASIRALVDYAEAAVAADIDNDARRRLPAILAQVPRPYSARVGQLVNHASALLNLGHPGEIFAATLDLAAGEQWPFERARLRLSYAGWLRRNRRRKEAQHHLSAVLATFEKLGARPWIDTGARELRASGVRAADPSTPTTVHLSPQEHQVVYLASEGMTNPQIATRLNLSPRTVSGHLYRSFPKLGVTSRHQIRDIPPPPDWQSSAG